MLNQYYSCGKSSDAEDDFFVIYNNNTKEDVRGAPNIIDADHSGSFFKLSLFNN